MPQFTVQESLAGAAVTFGPNYPGVEIALKPPQQLEHGQGYVLTPPLASDKEIDVAVDRLRERLEERLEAARVAAKRMLKDYQTRAGGSAE